MAFHQNGSIRFVCQAKRNKKVFVGGRDKRTIDFLVERVNTLFLNINQNNLSIQVKKSIQECRKIINPFEARYMKYIDLSDYTKLPDDLAAKCEQIRNIRDCVRTLDCIFSWKQQQYLSNASQLAYRSIQQQKQYSYHHQSSALFSQPSSSNTSVSQVKALRSNTIVANNSIFLNKNTSSKSSTMEAWGNRILCGVEVFSVFHDKVNKKIILHTAGNDKMELIERLKEKSSAYSDFSLPVVKNCWASKFILTEAFYNSLMPVQKQDNATLELKRIT